MRCLLLVRDIRAAGLHAHLKVQCSTLQGFRSDEVSTERFLNLRYDGTDVAIMTACSSSSSYEEAFEDTYQREFGFTLEGRGIMVCVARSFRCQTGHCQHPEPFACTLGWDARPIENAGDNII